MSAPLALSTLGVCNQSLVNTVGGWGGGMGGYVAGTEKEPFGVITCTGWGLGGGANGHNTYRAASENSGPAAKHLGFHWPQPQSWC